MGGCDNVIAVRQLGDIDISGTFIVVVSDIYSRQIPYSVGIAADKLCQCRYSLQSPTDARPVHTDNCTVHASLQHWIMSQLQQPLQ